MPCLQQVLICLFQVNLILCCMFYLTLLCVHWPTANAGKRDILKYKAYLSKLHKANEILMNPNKTFDSLQELFGKRTRKKGYRVRKRRKRTVKVNSSQQMITPLPTNVVRCRIYCRSGFYLQLLPGGSVRGTAKRYNPFCK